MVLPFEQDRLDALFPSTDDTVEDVRAELSELAANNALERIHISWAIEQLVERGVELPLLMATVLDFAPSEWLQTPDITPRCEFDFEALAARLGIDPITGKPLTATPPLQMRQVHGAGATSSRIGRRATLAGAFGSEGIRQRPLAGWSKNR